MTIPGIARRLVAKYGRALACMRGHDRADAWSEVLSLVGHTLPPPDALKYTEYAAHWRSVARACLRVPAPEATP